jgi:hypothetical protein
MDRARGRETLMHVCACAQIMRQLMDLSNSTANVHVDQGLDMQHNIIAFEAPEARQLLVRAGRGRAAGAGMGPWGPARLGQMPGGGGGGERGVAVLGPWGRGQCLGLAVAGPGCAGGGAGGGRGVACRCVMAACRGPHAGARSTGRWGTTPPGPGLARLQVHSFGKCNTNMQMPTDANNDKQQVFRRYKFCVGGSAPLAATLPPCFAVASAPSQPAPCCCAAPAAMENSISEDYVTEKVWDALVSGCVPIYLGGGWGEGG